MRTLITTYSESSRARLQKILEEYDIKTEFVNNKNELKGLRENRIGLVVLPTQHGFQIKDITVITEQDLLGEKVIRRKTTTNKQIEKIIKDQSNIKEGELVVHRQHGLGRLMGLETIKTRDVENDYLKIAYADSAFLFVPIEHFDLITRYSEFNPLIQLDKLGSVKWSEKKARVRKKIKNIADELIKIASVRKLTKAPVLIANEGEYAEFCAKFPYTETDDQLHTIQEIEKDLSRGIPMDRLVCGDVGFGKTEVALRAAFIAAKSEKNSKQVAIISPTTLLCRQHYKEFKERFADTGLSIGQLSRMVSQSQIKKTKQKLGDGTLNIVIGTHALLSDSIKFKNLGLVIIDEEQRFGVKQKEKIKKLRNNTHILTLSATPIPRTLQMSISGIKDLSLITTPPVDRLIINTFIMDYDQIVIREAIQREIYRGGQIFFVVPKIKDIPEIEKKLKNILPNTKYKIAHGRIKPMELDRIMNDFYDGKFQILISTTIIESGLDIPTANTMIIYKADHFGLAQLYQLRGRVGRGKVKAYAYLTKKPKEKITENAQKRLEVMESLDTLGAGFTIASSDMDIRGSGNLVGEEQSGHIRETGVELYNYLLKEAVEKAKKEAGFEYEETHDFLTHIRLGVSTIIPKDYIEDINLRMILYRRISDIQGKEEQEELEYEITDRFGKIPEETRNLFEISILKNLCKKCNVSHLENVKDEIVILFHNNKFSNPEGLIKLIEINSEQISVKNGKEIHFKREGDDAIKESKRILKKLVGLIKE